MADLNYMATSTPNYKYRKDIFIFNDIDLIVPPSNISIQKEDLIWQWRALRVGSSTKIPSGQGQIAIQVNIPFTASMLLDMHRIIVEVTHSPFCYIENRFLRETIVPHWANTQHMAFTVTGLSVAPMQGSSDAWVMQLDMTWFNYKPYLHNWLYRRDWMTVPIRAEEPLDTAKAYRLTIGWGLEDNKRINRHVIMPAVTVDETIEAVRDWDGIRNQYKNKDRLTIDEMQQIHFGEVFDILPLSNRMQPAEYVSRPIDSNIYVRYINYLQRDALKRNFNIDIEADLGYDIGETIPELHNAFFSAVQTGNDWVTFPLHQGPFDLYSPMGISYSSLKKEWIQKMREFHSGAMFLFASYLEVQLPDTWKEKIEGAHQYSLNSIADSIGSTAVIDDESNFITKYRDGIPVKRYRVRNGFSNPVGHDGNFRVVPLGNLGFFTPMTCKEAYSKVTSYPKWRENGDTIYNDGREGGYIHWGTDISAEVGSPVFAIEEGTVTYINLMDDFNNLKWFHIEISPDEENGYIKSPIIDYDDFVNSVRSALGDNINYNFITKTFSSDFINVPPGTCIKSVSGDNNCWYIAFAKDGGNQILMSHGSNKSAYSHLSDISQEALNSMIRGTPIPAGTLIGYSGQTGPYSSEYLKKIANDLFINGFFDSYKSYTVRKGNYDYAPTLELGPDDKFYQLGAHLHVEYWETEEQGADTDPKYSDSIPLGHKAGKENHVPVDLRRAFANAIPDEYEIIRSRRKNDTSQTQIVASIKEDEDLSKKDKDGILDLLNTLWADDWLYYDGDSDVNNVWWKPFKLDIHRINFEGLTDADFMDSSLVLTAVAGGLRHVVTNIPILGHEYPTQQHLGSIEPFYSFEFCSVDSEGKIDPETGHDQRNAGISKDAEMLMAMRTTLHSNARRFRPICDSWAVSCDSFITRLLGSYVEGDVAYMPLEEDIETFSGGKAVADFKLTRRLISTRGSSSTIEGHPGLSSHVLEFSETNPYIGESINATAAKKEDMDFAYKEILNKIYRLEFKDEYKDLLPQILIAQLAGADTINMGDDNYGKFTLQYVSDPGETQDSGVGIYHDPTNETDYIIGTSGGTLNGIYDLVTGTQSNPLAKSNRFMDYLFGSKFQDVPSINGVKGIPLNSLFDEDSYTITTGKKIVATAGASAAMMGGNINSVESVVVKDLRINIAALLSQSQDSMICGELPLETIFSYWDLIDKTIISANMMFAEDSDQVRFGRLENGGGLSIDQIRGELYDLPIIPSLFKSFQSLLIEAAKRHPRIKLKGAEYWDAFAFSDFIRPDQTFDFNEYNDAIVVQHITSNPNWIVWNDRYQIDPYINNKIKFTNMDDITGIGSAAIGTAGRGFTALFSLISSMGHSITNWSTVSEAIRENPGKNKGVVTDWVNEQLDDVFSDIAAKYMSTLPLQEIVIEERFKSFIQESWFGDIAIGFTHKNSKTPVIANTIDELKSIVASCGNFTFSRGADYYIYIIDQIDISSGQRIVTRQPAGVALDKDYISFESYDGILSSIGYSFTNASNTFPLGSPFGWYSTKALEAQKIEYFKTLFAHYAQALLSNPDILEAFGLSSLARFFDGNKIAGSQALPDMKLPEHPYYGTVFDCPADFYMWNIYEDGCVYNIEGKEEIYDAITDTIDRCYDSMKKIEKGVKYDNKMVQEPETEFDSSQQLILYNRMQAEGTDSGSVGAMACPYYPDKAGDVAVKEYFDRAKIVSEKEKLEAASKAALSQSAIKEQNGVDIDSDNDTDNDNTPTFTSFILSSDDYEALSNKKVNAVRASAFEGPFGEGGGVQYPRRFSTPDYEALSKAVKESDQMFGHRAGYLAQQEFPSEINKILKGTTSEHQVQPSHTFDRESLRSLARESANDMFGQKRSMKRAYPTFKLFFVEEDEYESRLLNFDDFYSYNEVVDFTVEQSRKSPADHAVITLLNVAGTLDGTKRNAITDLDYFGESSKVSLPDKSPMQLGGTNTVSGTVLDQPFGALVLRPGLNVQLRAGYSNDPDLLEVLINGRIVDITWNQGGDRVEIMVQSFGTELVQAIKGTNHSFFGDAYPTTHHLLGAMMLEPELAHFGRWEFGKLYQIREGKDSRIDARDYSQDEFLGNLTISTKVVKFFLSHPVLTTGLMIAGSLLFSRLPGRGAFARTFGKTGQVGKRLPWVAKWMEKTSFGKLATASESGFAANANVYSEKTIAKEMIKVVRARVGKKTGITVATEITAAEIATVRRLLKHSNNWLLKYLGKISPAMRTEGIARYKAGVKAIDEAVAAKGGAISINEAASLVKGLNSSLRGLAEKEMLMAKPLAKIGTGGVSLASAIGIKPLKRVFGGYFTRTPIFIAKVGAVGLAADGVFDLILKPIYEATLGRVKAYFQSKKVSLFISPQDDNLYPPHPKDYMMLYEMSNWQKTKGWIAQTTIGAFSYDYNLGQQVGRWFSGVEAYDKRVEVEACKYTPYSTTIWDVFHEMSLRHPGWVYGARPYGKEFRYTMFFGVPSQRYWARGADNTFIKRANDLYRLLNNSSSNTPEINMQEYRRLYGDIIHTDGGDVAVDEYFDDLMAETRRYAVQHYKVVTLPNGQEVEVRPVDKIGDGVARLYREGNSFITTNAGGSIYSPLEQGKAFKAIVSNTLTGVALKEYLLALNQRFVPFRRYHSLTSEHDIVWNGLMSSENAMYNAVDVSYRETGADEEETAVSSLLMKAHAFIPESQLRVLPLPPMHNCYGYEMATRYGQGTLLHTIRDMYRGEIVILGNTRIRPWDIAVISDSYNDMVGPVEIERVVHQFSHSTGFITEIKPSAVVIANELSSWPVLEAMKVAALAIRDKEDSFEGIRAGVGNNIMNWMLGEGSNPEYFRYLNERAKTISPEDIFKDVNGDSNDLETINKIEEDFNIIGRRIVGTIGLGVGVASGYLAFRCGPAKALAAAGKSDTLIRLGTGASTLLGGLSGYGITTATFNWGVNELTPSLSWLLGGQILMLSCLRGDNIMVVPLMKNGHPIVSGFNLSDPSMLWSNYKGELARMADDMFKGAKDLAGIWRMYGIHSWRRLDSLKEGVEKQWGADIDNTDELLAELTGRE